jgi:putative transposase
MIEDVHSRKVVGWEVHDRECGELAAQLFQRSGMRE